MSRPKKSTVDYFPHDTQHKTTIPILEAKWGNDGYAFFFKLLEVLGSTDNHFIDAGNPARWEFFLSKTRLSEVTATEILDLLAKLQTIDPDLWANYRVIYIQNFVDRVSDAYRKRLDQKPTLEKVKNMVSGGRNSQSAGFPAEEIHNPSEFPAEESGKVKESKVKERKNISSEAIQLSDMMADLILSNNPRAIELLNGKREATVQRWADDIDKLHRIDGQAWEDIRSVIQWAQSDTFWHKNILSGATVRKQWSKLAPQALSDKTSKACPIGSYR